ncbi:MAG: type II toxin-antitoxin system HicB family antitoxin [Gammaproteobacteria bacterium]|nr:type II toxin-antitoxin system HicB family antitoxin [Gammaproteobacteria bacterium]
MRVRKIEGEYLATARDVPEAVTNGKTRDETIQAMSDALGAALAGYALAGQDVPLPSPAKRGERMVLVVPLVAAKLALRSAMRDEGVGNADLARRLAVSEGAARRLVDPDHASRIDGVVAALAVLGRAW